MAESDGIIFGEKATQQIAKTVREVSRRMMNEQPHRARWQFHGGSLDIRHGIVFAQRGCGYYTIELATWAGNEDTAGSGLGSGSGIADCDVCYDIHGEGTTGCGITLTYPPLQVIGTGVYVKAYDSASGLIPLVPNTSCKLVNLGDENNGEPIWQIVRGMMQHEVYYEEVWDCCEPDGPETLITRTPSIMIAKRCSPISCGECPASGSGSG